MSGAADGLARDHGDQRPASSVPGSIWGGGCGQSEIKLPHPPPQIGHVRENGGQGPGPLALVAWVRGERRSRPGSAVTGRVDAGRATVQAWVRCHRSGGCGESDGPGPGPLRPVGWVGGERRSRPGSLPLVGWVGGERRSRPGFAATGRLVGGDRRSRPGSAATGRLGVESDGQRADSDVGAALGNCARALGPASRAAVPPSRAGVPPSRRMGERPGSGAAERALPERGQRRGFRYRGPRVPGQAEIDARCRCG
ncbi:hypothetical protein DFJ67_0445 [Asanoa ferruginea]|uniref:Uncharacterized protein n=1 Tax=Asanoa ferruginea TaxID=53367 RepID=A0A3D9ZB75_9ACTN|nr:hypothetical protein DFJ67_0445 [Asanoa ferruginea]